METEQSNERKGATNERESMYSGFRICPKIFFAEVLVEGNRAKAIGLSYFKERWV